MLKDSKSSKSKPEKLLETERESHTTKTTKDLKDNLEKESPLLKDNKPKKLLNKNQPLKDKLPKLKLLKEKPEEEVQEKDNNDLLKRISLFQYFNNIIINMDKEILLINT